MMDLLSWSFKLAGDFGQSYWSEQQQQQYTRDLALLEAAALQYYYPAALAHWMTSSATVYTTEIKPNHHQTLSFGIDRILGDQVGTQPTQPSDTKHPADDEQVALLVEQEEQHPSTEESSSSSRNNGRRKRSWSRAVFSNLQRKGLEKRFQLQKYITKPDRRQLAATLGLTDAQVKVWFQNRRMKWRHTKDRLGVSGSNDNGQLVTSDEIYVEDNNLPIKFD